MRLSRDYFAKDCSTNIHTDYNVKIYKLTTETTTCFEIRVWKYEQLCINRFQFVSVFSNSICRFDWNVEAKWDDRIDYLATWASIGFVNLWNAQRDFFEQTWNYWYVRYKHDYITTHTQPSQLANNVSTTNQQIHDGNLTCESMWKMSKLVRHRKDNLEAGYARIVKGSQCALIWLIAQKLWLDIGSIFDLRCKI